MQTDGGRNKLLAASASSCNNKASMKPLRRCKNLEHLA